MSTPARRTKTQIAADLEKFRQPSGEEGNAIRGEHGMFRKGNPGGPGRPKGAKLSKEIAGQYEEDPTELHYKMAALGLGIDRCDVPVFETVTALHVWVFSLHGLRGSEAHARELLDRVEPKVSRAQIDLDGNLGRPGVGAAASVGDEDADRYYRRLRGEEPSDE